MDSFNKINVSLLQFNRKFPNQTIYHLPEMFVEFIIANLVFYHTKNFQNKATFIFL